MGETAFGYLYALKKRGQLPGWSQLDKFANRAETFHTHSFGFAALDFLKKGDSSIYNYQVTRETEDRPWKLQKAWRTEQSGHVIEEYDCGTKSGLEK